MKRIVEPGEFEILVGASSRDIRLNAIVTLEPEKRAARLHKGLLLKSILDDPNGRAVLSRYIGSFPFMADMKLISERTLEQVAHDQPAFVSKEMLKKIDMELARY